MAAAAAAASRALLLAGAPLLPGRLLGEVFADCGAPIDGVDVATRAGHPGQPLEAASASYDAVYSYGEAPGHHGPFLLAELLRVLKAGGKLVIQEPVGRRAASAVEVQALGTSAAVPQTRAGFERNLVMAGFSNIKELTSSSAVGLARQWMGVTPAAVGSQQGPLLQPLSLRAEKPAWVGTSFALKKKVAQVSASPVSDVSPAITSSSGRAGVPSWKVSAVDAVDDEDELVDEDALLTAEDLERPTLMPEAAASDCGLASKSRKACKNCSCGRAELEDAQATKKLTLDQIENPQSACGSCGLGDAFRCAGCPYKGLPPFKLGDKIALSGSLLIADA
eukprot:SM000090S24302  [mRNA]  locus=s90:130305:132935:- [translate_table: standard]